jgi:hypothetical protein
MKKRAKRARPKQASLKLRDALLTVDELCDKLAVVQRQWTEDELLCRAHGITDPDHGASFATIAKRIREELTENILNRVRVFRHDRRRFDHSYFERGGWCPPSMVFSVFDDWEHHPSEGGFFGNIQS